MARITQYKFANDIRYTRANARNFIFAIYRCVDCNSLMRHRGIRRNHRMKGHIIMLHSIRKIVPHYLQLNPKRPSKYQKLVQRMKKNA